MLYKLIFDVEKVDFQAFIDILKQQQIEACFANDFFYLHTTNNKPVPIRMIMKKIKVSDYFATEITEEPKIISQSLAEYWCLEKFRADAQQRFDEEHRKEFQQMLDNIAAVKELIEKKQGGLADGESDRQEESGTSAESAAD